MTNTTAVFWLLVSMNYLFFAISFLFHSFIERKAFPKKNLCRSVEINAFGCRWAFQCCLQQYTFFHFSKDYVLDYVKSLNLIPNWVILELYVYDFLVCWNKMAIATNNGLHKNWSIDFIVTTQILTKWPSIDENLQYQVIPNSKFHEDISSSTSNICCGRTHILDLRKFYLNTFPYEPTLCTLWCQKVLCKI